MLIETIYEKYKAAQEQHNKYSQAEGFYGSDLERISKNTLTTLGILYYVVVSIFILLVLPMAIYYILVLSAKYRLSKIKTVLLILLLGLPKLGFFVALFIICFGYLDMNNSKR